MSSNTSKLTKKLNVEAPKQEIEQPLDASAEIIESGETMTEIEAQDPGAPKFGLVFDQQVTRFSDVMFNGQVPVWRIRYYNPEGSRDVNGVNVLPKAYHVFYKTGKAAISACAQADKYQVPTEWLIVRSAGGVAINLAKVEADKVSILMQNRDFTKYKLETPAGDVVVSTRRNEPLLGLVKELTNVINKASVWIGFDPTGRRENVSQYMEQFYDVLVEVKFERKDVFVIKTAGYQNLYRPTMGQKQFCTNTGKFYKNQPFIFSVMDTLSSDDPSASFAQKIQAKNVRKAINGAANREAKMNEVEGVVLPLEVPCDAVKVDPRTAKVVVDTLDSLGMIINGYLDLTQLPDGLAIGLHPWKEDFDSKVRLLISKESKYSKLTQKALQFTSKVENADYTYILEIGK